MINSTKTYTYFNCLAFLLVLSLLTGCSGKSVSQAQGTTSVYLKSILDQDFAKASSLLSGKDKNNESITKFQKEDETTPEEKKIRKLILGQIDYSIIKADYVSSEKIHVYISLMGPELGAIIEDLLTLKMSEFSDYKTYREYLIYKYKTGNYGYISTLIMYVLVKEGDSWKVSFEQEDPEKKAETKAETVTQKWNSLLEKETKLNKIRDILDTIIAIRELLYLNAESGFTESYVKRIIKFQKNRLEKKEYFEKLELSNLKMDKWTLGSNDWANQLLGNEFSETKRGIELRAEKGIYGTVKNTGEKTIGKIEFKVELLNQQDEIIGEFSAVPLNSSNLMSMPDTPLKPNFEKDFSFPTRTRAPASWEGKFKLTVQDIVFGVDD